MTSDELRAAARRFIDGDRGVTFITFALIDIIKQWLAANPADDDDLVTEESLRAFCGGAHLASCPWKRYALHFATDKFGRALGWCPPCGNLAPCICLDEWVLIENPRMGDVRNLCAALGITLAEGGRR